MFFTWARAATSGTTPPILLCNFIWEFTMDDSVVISGHLPPMVTSKTAAAVSSQLVSIARMTFLFSPSRERCRPSGVREGLARITILFSPFGGDTALRASERVFPARIILVCSLAMLFRGNSVKMFFVGNGFLFGGADSAVFVFGRGVDGVKF